MTDYGVRRCCVPTCERLVPRNRKFDVCSTCGLEIAVAHFYEASLRDELYRRRQAQAEERAEARRAQRASTERVYYVALDDERVKIGYTHNIRSRLTALRLRPAALLASEPGGREVEAVRHQQFAKWRLGRREDFLRSAELMDWIDGVREEHGLPRWASLPDTTLVTRRQA